MVLILSQDEAERTTDEVIDWLDYFQGKYLRLNGSDYYKEVVIKNGVMQLDGFSPDDFNIVWSRRWVTTSAISRLYDSSLNSIGGRNAFVLINFIHDENRVLKSFLNKSLANKEWTNFPKYGPNRKLNNLELAKKCGLSIPDYIITSKKEYLSEFVKIHKRIICKPISEVPALYANTGKNTSETIIPYTISLNEAFVEQNIAETFYASLFQKEIEKEFEIRTFFLNGECHSMAIFSQNDDQTKVDFRNYNNEIPNRKVPFLLPKQIEKNIIKFCQEGGYKIGSLDLIKSTDGNYYFLEINPRGQFGMISYPCNYYLERKLAKYLMNEDIHIKKRNS